MSYNLSIKDKLRTTNLINNPPHIVDDDGNIQISALIPFCDLGGNMSTTGTKIQGISLPVCNVFKRKILRDRVCYQLNVMDFVANLEMELIIKNGLVLVLDYNEEKMLTKKIIAKKENIRDLSDAYMNHNSEEKEALVYVETLGIIVIEEYLNIS